MLTMQWGVLFLVQFIYEGKVIKQNNQKALEYFNKACKLKDEDGCKNYIKLKSQMQQ